MNTENLIFIQSFISLLTIQEIIIVSFTATLELWKSILLELTLPHTVILLNNVKL